MPYFCLQTNLIPKENTSWCERLLDIANVADNAKGQCASVVLVGWFEREERREWRASRDPELQVPPWTAVFSLLHFEVKINSGGY